MNKRILVVDDSAMMRKLITKMVEPGGHVVVGEAKNGLEAVQLYKSLKPDLVTMDITMRDMDGFAAAKEILRFDDAAQIIFLSNLDVDRYGQDAQRLGAVGYVNKHQSRELMDIINNP